VSHLRPERLAQAARRPLGDGERRHVDGCAACARAFDRVRASQATLRAVAASEPPEPSPVALVRAEASIRWTRVTPEPAVRRRFVVALALATACALALAWATRDWTRAPVDHGAPATAMARLARPAPAGLTALVTLVGGDVRLVRAGATRRLDFDARLAAGDRLATGATARVAAQWSEGSGFLLFGDGELALARLETRTQRLELERGKISVRVGPHEPGESLQVITPDHVVSVHGTWFNVASAQHVTTVEVLEGTVEVLERDGSSATLLTAPARAVFGHGRASSAALSAHEAARARAASEMNLVAWAGLEAARAASGALVVASDPPAELAVDGVALGATPLSVRRPLGSHLVELTRPGFASLRQWTAVGREPGELRLALVHAPPPESDSVPIEIESMVRRRATQIRACYERRLKRDPSLAGTVSLRLRVGGAGQVKGVTVEESTLPDELVGECLRREAAGWSFAVGRNATVVYPFVFRPQ
jgi:ferric-dicitrate binding protein FerR (iron transport regulator)